MNDEMNVINRKDGTPFGIDITEEGKKVWYFIQADYFGDGRRYGIWNPDNRLRSYKSFKEALVYLAIADENPILPKTKYRVVRSYVEFDFRNITVIATKKEEEYYRPK